MSAIELRRRIDRAIERGKGSMMRFRWWVADIKLKLKMLWLYRGLWSAWYSDVWKQDPDQQMCCSGYECGCQGSCYSDMWEHLWKTRKGHQ